MTHCSNKLEHTPNHVQGELPYWGLRGQNAVLGPIRSSEILVPCPWPDTLRIPGRTLPTAGRCRRIKLTQCGPLGLLDTDPVPGLRELRPYFPATGPPISLNPQKNQTVNQSKELEESIEDGAKMENPILEKTGTDKKNSKGNKKDTKGKGGKNKGKGGKNKGKK